jgi:hypothetical protein
MGKVERVHHLDGSHCSTNQQIRHCSDTGGDAASDLVGSAASDLVGIFRD